MPEAFAKADQIAGKPHLAAKLLLFTLFLLLVYFVNTVFPYSFQDESLENTYLSWQENLPGKLTFANYLGAVQQQSPYHNRELLYFLWRDSAALLTDPTQLTPDNEDYLAYCKWISELVTQSGRIPNQQLHYLRNQLILSIENLAQLKEYQNTHPDAWILYTAENSLLQLNGPDGIFNLKFAAADKSFELVFCKAEDLNRLGSARVIREAADPFDNSGTYNYAAGDLFQHILFDVVPSYLYGNTAAKNGGFFANLTRFQKNSSANQKAYAASLTAQAYRQAVAEYLAK
ncbi:MAG: hypothetical protein LLG09_00650 [Negativicutes bacterium]|nr:hypothetical protein [Negativicutes bacterium]